MFKRLLTAITGLLCGMILILGLATVGKVQAQGRSCELVNNQERMLVFFAPIFTKSQVKDILPKHTPYKMIDHTESFFQIEYNNGERGWIDFHTQILNGSCASFANQAPTVISLENFPTMCLYTTTEALTIYTDPDLSQAHQGLGKLPIGTYPTTFVSQTAVGIAGSSAMSGGYVEIDHGRLSGHCNGTVRLAMALGNTRVWEYPTVIDSLNLATLEYGQEVIVLQGPVEGRIQIDNNEVDNFYEINIGDLYGWVWEDRLDLGRTFTTPQKVLATATTLENARIWSAPDAQQGKIVTQLPPGIEVDIIGESENGFIQLESNLRGLWYPIQLGGTIGWIFEDRLEFIEDNG